MSTEMTLIGGMLILVEGDLDSPDAIRVRKMIDALERGAISEARFEEWVCLREATA
jgi:hypothetical protein